MRPSFLIVEHADILMGMHPFNRKSMTIACVKILNTLGMPISMHNASSKKTGRIIAAFHILWLMSS